jgi:hypothetical protein
MFTTGSLLGFLRQPNLQIFTLALAVAFAAMPVCAQPASDRTCGEVVTVETHDRTTTRYAITMPQDGAPAPRAALVLMVGGGGDLKMDERGCARALDGNPLVRAIADFLANGLITVLVDTPSDYPGEDGLAGFRLAPAHADDLGKIITDVRARTNAPVWLAGHSRGTVSVANAGARLKGPAAPDGIVLMSAMMVGGGKSYAAQTVFDPPLEDIRMPVLVLGHADDKCVRSPASQMNRITARSNGAREQVVVLTGGSTGPGGATSLEACGARMPHGFLNLDAEFAAGIARFIRGGNY